MLIQLTPDTTIESDTVAEFYSSATAGDKTKIRNAVTAAMHEAVRAGDFGAAKAWSDVAEAIKTAKPVVTETDVNRVVADRIIALRHAAHRLTMGDVTPDGIDATKVDTDTVAAMVAEWTDAADLDAVTDEVAAAAVKVATAKITRTTVRGSIESHIEAAFDGMPVGTVLTVAQIKTRSGAASGGAITARLWPAGDKEVTLDLVALGVELTTMDGTPTGTRAVRKVA